MATDSKQLPSIDTISTNGSTGSLPPIGGAGVNYHHHHQAMNGSAAAAPRSAVVSAAPPPPPPPPPTSASTGQTSNTTPTSAGFNATSQQSSDPSGYSIDNKDVSGSSARPPPISTGSHDNGQDSLSNLTAAAQMQRRLSPPSSTRASDEEENGEKAHQQQHHHHHQQQQQQQQQQAHQHQQSYRYPPTPTQQPSEYAYYGPAAPPPPMANGHHHQQQQPLPQQSQMAPQYRYSVPNQYTATLLPQQEPDVRHAEVMEFASQLYHICQMASGPEAANVSLEQLHEITTRSRTIGTMMEAWYARLYSDNQRNAHMRHQSAPVSMYPQQNGGYSHPMQQGYPMQPQQQQQQQQQQHSHQLYNVGDKRPIDESSGRVKKRARQNLGETHCRQCGISETPEWRRGPDGARTLCNACGLYHAKLVKRRGELEAAKIMKSKRDNNRVVDTARVARN